MRTKRKGKAETRQCAHGCQATGKQPSTIGNVGMKNGPTNEKKDEKRKNRIRFGIRTKRRKMEYNETMIENISLTKERRCCKYKSLLFRAC